MGETPKLIVFDLDGCVWRPEMYELWGSGGAPFTKGSDGDLVDKCGNKIELIGYTREILKKLRHDTRYKDTVVAISSGCDEPTWAFECLSKFEIEEKVKISDFITNIAIDKRQKKNHIKQHCGKLNINDFKSVLFFDNEMGNCKNVASLGCTAIYCPEGLTEKAWIQGIDSFPSKGEVISISH